MIDAVNRLRNQASIDRCRKWHPGQKPTDAEQIIKYIDNLEARIADQSEKLYDYRWATDTTTWGA